LRFEQAKASCSISFTDDRALLDRESPFHHSKMRLITVADPAAQLVLATERREIQR